MIHEFSDSEKKELNTLINNIKYSFRESFKRINSEFIQTKNELNAIRRKIRDAESNQEDPIIESYPKQREELEKEIIRIEENIGSYERTIGELSNQKNQKKKKIEELSKKLEVSAKNKHKDEVLSRNISTLKKFIAEFKLKKKESLEKQIHQGLNTYSTKRLY